MTDYSYTPDERAFPPALRWASAILTVAIAAVILFEITAVTGLI